MIKVDLDAEQFLLRRMVLERQGNVVGHNAVKIGTQTRLELLQLKRVQRQDVLFACPSHVFIEDPEYSCDLGRIGIGKQTPIMAEKIHMMPKPLQQ